MMAYSMANSKHKHGVCRGREQSRIGILIRLRMAVFHFPYIRVLYSMLTDVTAAPFPDMPSDVVGYPNYASL